MYIQADVIQYEHVSTLFFLFPSPSHSLSHAHNLSLTVSVSLPIGLPVSLSLFLCLSPSLTLPFFLSLSVDCILSVCMSLSLSPIFSLYLSIFSSRSRYLSPCLTLAHISLSVRKARSFLSLASTLSRERDLPSSEKDRNRYNTRDSEREKERQ